MENFGCSGFPELIFAFLDGLFAEVTPHVVEVHPTWSPDPRGASFGLLWPPWGATLGPLLGSFDVLVGSLGLPVGSLGLLGASLGPLLGSFAVPLGSLGLPVDTPWPEIDA